MNLDTGKEALKHFQEEVEVAMKDTILCRAQKMKNLHVAAKKVTETLDSIEVTDETDAPLTDMYDKIISIVDLLLLSKGKIPCTCKCSHNK